MLCETLPPLRISVTPMAVSTSPALLSTSIELPSLARTRPHAPGLRLAYARLMPP